MKIKQYLFLTSALLLLSSCNNQESTSETTDATSTSEITSSEDSSTNSVEFENQSYLVETSRVDTNKWGDAFNSGFQFDNVDNIEALRSYLDDGHNLISSIECNKVQSGGYDNNGKECALQIGSSSSDGYMTFHFAKPISGIQFTFMTYNKTHTGGQTVDPSSKITLSTDNETKTIDLTPVAGNPQIVGDQMSFPNGTTTFKLETTGYTETRSAGRVLIQYFVFEY